MRKHPKSEAREKYLHLFLAVFNEFLEGSGSRMTGRTTVSEKAGVGVVSLEMTNKKSRERKHRERASEKEFDELLKNILQFLEDSPFRSIRYNRNLKVFDGESLHILKPLTMRYWCKTAALNDADETAMEILQSH